jgi:diacylglycerol kinase (ATP)
LTVFKKTFINYLSIGYDARVGFGFEKGRCGNRCCNKLLYFWEGCKKNCCRNTIKLNSLIDKFQTVTIKEDIDVEDMDVTLREDKAKAYTLFKSRTSLESVSSGTTAITTNGPGNAEEIVLKGDPVSIVCQNIHYYMGGTRDIWKKSGSQLGIEYFEKNNNKEMLLKKQMENIITAEQSYNDGKLEFFTYSSGLKLGFEKISTGQADKVHQGVGPYLLKFKPTPEKVNFILF